MSTKEKLLIMRQNVLQVVLNSTALPFRWLRSCFRCFYCYEIFIEPKDLKIHSNIHLYNEKYETVEKFMETVVYIDVSNLSCRLCPYDIKDLYKLIEHFEEKHQISLNKEIGLCMYPFRLNDNSFDCCECDGNFRSFSHLLRHTNKAHKGFCDILCDLCGQHFKNKNLLKQHIVKTHERKPRKCSQCDVIITNPNHLRTHMQRYHGKKYKCFMCSEDFSTHYQRSQHMMNIHQDKQLTCPHCPRTFVFKSIMQRHVRETHLHEKNVECPVCGWQAFEANRLQRHMMKHSNERNFKCDMCEKAFKTRKTMRQHFMNIHEKVKISLPEGLMQS